jgi:hypothetical protein
MIVVRKGPSLSDVQLAFDSDKRLTWPVYVAGLRVRLKSPACLMVVTSSEA